MDVPQEPRRDSLRRLSIAAGVMSETLVAPLQSPTPAPVPAPVPPSSSSGAESKSFVSKRSTRSLFQWLLWANYLKCCVFIRGSVLMATPVTISSAIVLCKDWGIADAFGRATGLNRSVCCMFLGRFLLWQLMLWGINIPGMFTRKYWRGNWRAALQYWRIVVFSYIPLSGALTLMARSEPRLFMIDDTSPLTKVEKMKLVGLHFLLDLVYNYSGTILRKLELNSWDKNKSKLVDAVHALLFECIPSSLIVWLWFGTIVALVLFSQNDLSVAVRVLIFGVLASGYKAFLVALSLRVMNMMQVGSHTGRERVIMTVEVVAGVGAMVSMFRSVQSLPLFVAQFATSEVIEQVTAWGAHHPLVKKFSSKTREKAIKQKTTKIAPEAAEFSIEERVDNSTNVSSKNGDGEESSKIPVDTTLTLTPPIDNSVTAYSPMLSIDEGTTLIGRECGEDLSVFMAFVASIPVVTQYFFYPSHPSHSDSERSTSDVLLAYLVAVLIEHVLSVVGILTFDLNGIEMDFSWAIAVDKQNFYINFTSGATLLCLVAAGLA